MYVLAIPDQIGRTANYVLDLGSAATANVYTLTPGKDAITKTTVK
jgi:hypothetical protein